MEISSLTQAVGAEFAPKTTYLNTSSCGLLPRRTVEAVKALADENAAGTGPGAGSFDAVDAARVRFAGLVGVGPDRVATGSSVAVHVGLIAASLAPGAEVLVPEGEFSSVVGPLAARGDLRMRYVPLDGMAEAVRPTTSLVALSSVQSADGRLADLDAVRAAATTHGARVLLDATQSAGWLPLDAGAYDYTVTGGFKFLLCPRGTSFLTVTEEAQETLPPLFASWVAGEDRWNSTYGPIGRLAAPRAALTRRPPSSRTTVPSTPSRCWARSASTPFTPTPPGSRPACGRGWPGWGTRRCRGSPRSWPCLDSAGGNRSWRGPG